MSAEINRMLSQSNPQLGRMLDEQERQKALQQQLAPTNYGNSGMGMFLTAASGAQKSLGAGASNLVNQVNGAQAPMGMNEQTAMQNQAQQAKVAQQEQTNLQNSTQTASSIINSYVKDGRISTKQGATLINAAATKQMSLEEVTSMAESMAESTKSAADELFAKDSLKGTVAAAKEVLVTSGLSKQQQESILRAIELDKSGTVAGQVLSKYGSPDVVKEEEGVWKSLGDGSNTIFNDKSGNSKAIKVENGNNGGGTLGGRYGSGKSGKPLSLADQYRLSTEDLTSEDMSSVTTLALNLEGQGLEQEAISMKLNNRIVEIIDKKNANKAKEEQEFKAQKAAAIRSSADNVIDVANKAIAAAPDNALGAFANAFTQFLPFTDARDLNGYVETLQANLAFDSLQAMREASKTGGALGNISNIELGLLKAELASLDPLSSTFKEQVQRVINHYTNFKMALDGKMPESPNYRVLNNVTYELKDGVWMEYSNDEPK